MKTRRNIAIAITTFLFAFTFCMTSCSNNAFENHFAMQMPNGVKIMHYENRSGFMDSHHIMVLNYDDSNVPALFIHKLKLIKFTSHNGAKAGVISSEWPSWWQSKLICKIPNIYEKIEPNEFAWFWFDRENKIIYLQWGTH